MSRTEWCNCKSCGREWNDAYSPDWASYCENCPAELCSSCIVNDHLVPVEYRQNETFARFFTRDSGKLNSIVPYLRGFPFFLSSGEGRSGRRIAWTFCPFCTREYVQNVELINYLMIKYQIALSDLEEEYRQERTLVEIISLSITTQDSTLLNDTYRAEDLVNRLVAELSSPKWSTRANAGEALSRLSEMSDASKSLASKLLNAESELSTDELCELEDAYLDSEQFSTFQPMIQARVEALESWGRESRKAAHFLVAALHSETVDAAKVRMVHALKNFRGIEPPVG